MSKLTALRDRYKAMPVAVKAATWYLICSFLTRGISFISTPIFTKLMSTAEYGEFGVFTSWEGIFAVLMTLNLPWGVYEQGLVKFEDNKKTFISSIQMLMTALVLVWLVLAIVFRDFFTTTLGLPPERMIPLVVIMWTNAVFCFWSNAQRIDYNYRPIIILTILTTLLKLVIGVIAVKSAADKVTARIWSMTAVEVIFFTGLFFKQWKEGKKAFDFSIWSYAFFFNLKLVPHYLAQTVLNGADKIMIERMVDKSSAGMYGLAYSLSQVMLIFNTVLLQTIGPWAFRRIKAKNLKDLGRVLYPALVFVAIANLMLILIAPEAIAFFGHGHYSDAIWVVPPVAMSSVFIFMYGLFSYFEFYEGKTAFISGATMVGALLNIVLNYIFIGRFGYYAAGYTTLFCYIIYAICHFYVMQTKCLKEEKVFDGRILLLGSAVFLALGFLFMMTYRSNVIRYSLLGAMALGLLIFGRRIVRFAKNLLVLRKEGKEE